MKKQISKTEISRANPTIPLASISRDFHLNFNACFCAEARVNSKMKVNIYADEETFQLFLEFVQSGGDASFNLIPIDRKNPNGGVFVSIRALAKHLPWIGRIALMPKRKDRQFNPVKEGKEWVLSLFPNFEKRFNRFEPPAQKDIAGIYRYLRSSGEIMYIGKGRILERLKSPGRESWDFDLVEYTEMTDNKAMYSWENYWLEKYKADSGGKLPPYNVISGSSRQD